MKKVTFGRIPTFKIDDIKPSFDISILGKSQNFARSQQTSPQIVCISPKNQQSLRNVGLMNKSALGLTSPRMNFVGRGSNSDIKNEIEH
jgi:hypothetical protein